MQYTKYIGAWWIPVRVALIIVIATIPFYKGWIWRQQWMIKLLIVVAIWFVSVLSVVFCFLGGITGSPILLPRMKRKSWYRKNNIETHKKTRRSADIVMCRMVFVKNIICRQLLKMGMQKHCMYLLLLIIKQRQVGRRF